jgi:formylglycine-generating enzyme required for sulfatase activity
MGRSDSGSDACPANMPCRDDEQPEHAVTVSPYALDKYEVTVGRFRKFLDAYETGWRPAAGQGAHPHAAGTGWNALWSMPVTRTAFESVISCFGDEHAWTPTAGASESVPINCVNWWQAQAFCIWDGGRLPTEAEWEYAAAGGAQDQLYPCGNDVPTCQSDGTCPSHVHAAGNLNGIGPFGHLNLGTGRLEWVFDWWSATWYSDPAASGTDVVNLVEGSGRVVRGGFLIADTSITARAAYRILYGPEWNNAEFGLRCARNP